MRLDDVHIWAHMAMSAASAMSGAPTFDTAPQKEKKPKKHAGFKTCTMGRQSNERK